MKRVLSIVLFFSSLSLHAADASLALVGSYRSSSGNAVQGSLSRDFAVGVGSGAGIGVEYRQPISDRWSLDLSAQWSESELTFSSPVETKQSLGDVRETPLRAMLVASFPHARITPWFGAGASYTLLELTDDRLLQQRGTADLDLEDELSWAAKGGVDISLTRAHAFTIGAVYSPLETRFTATEREPLEIELEPLTFFAGFRTTF